MIRRAAAAFLAVVLAACGSAVPSGGTAVPSGGTVAPATVSDAPQGSIPPGSSHLPSLPDAAGRPGGIADPAAGLSALDAYRATLTYSYTGTQGGKPSDWSQRFVLGVARPSNARVLEYAATGLGNGPPPYLALEGTVGDAHVVRSEPGAPCAGGDVTNGVDGPGLPEPARMLPKVRTVRRTGATDVAGIAASTYAFDATDVVTGGSAGGSGSATVAASGLVLAMDVAVTAGEDVFGSGTNGTMSWAYRLEPLDATVSVIPADCPTPLPNVPMPGDARNVQRYPGYLAYQTASGVPAIAQFYRDRMPAAGFAPIGSQWEGALGASSAWSKDGQDLQVVAAIGVPVTVTVTRKAPAGEPVPTPIPQATTAAEAGMVRVAQAYTKLTGTDTTPSELGSYHLAYNGTSSAWREKVATTTTAVTADVAGADVHFVVKETAKGKTTSTEGYKVGGTDYEVTGGKARPDDGFASMAWLTWPLDVVVALGIGSLKTASEGAATVAGRPAEVYRITGTLADDPTGMFASFGLPITATDGTVWVDAATGALLKADVRYTADLKDSDGKVRATHKDGFTLEISKAGETAVSLP